jgi:hypothetical protein
MHMLSRSANSPHVLPELQLCATARSPVTGPRVQRLRAAHDAAPLLPAPRLPCVAPPHALRVAVQPSPPPVCPPPHC